MVIFFIDWQIGSLDCVQWNCLHKAFYIVAFLQVTVLMKTVLVNHLHDLCNVL